MLSEVELPNIAKLARSMGAKPGSSCLAVLACLNGKDRQFCTGAVGKLPLGAWWTSVCGHFVASVSQGAEPPSHSPCGSPLELPPHIEPSSRCLNGPLPG